MKRLLVAALMFGAATSANAVVQLNFSGGSSAPAAGHDVIYDFNDFDLGVLDAGHVNTIIQSATNSDGARPFFANSAPAEMPYLSIKGGGTATISFDKPMTEISFDWGSLDDYNNLTIHVLGGTPISFTPTPPNVGGDQGSPLTNGLFTISGTAGELFTGLTFTSGTNSFEVDNIGGIAVPEMSTWAMMIAGFGLIGGALRRRERAQARLSYL